MSADFFQKYVVPAYEDWRKNPSDIRLAKLLASELNNIAEHYWTQNHQTSPTMVDSTSSATRYRDSLANILPEFGLIRDVAECHKHVFLDRRSAKIRSDNDVAVESIGYGQAYGLRYGGGDVVAVKLKNEEVVYFDILSEKVYQYWKSLFT